MATVRFSKELVQQIRTTAEAKMQPAVDAAVAKRPDNSWGQKIYDTMFGSVSTVLAQLPDGWLETTGAIDIVRVGSERCNLNFMLAVPKPWPHKFFETDLAVQPVRYSGSIALKDHLAWGELYAEVKAYNERVSAAKARQAEFVESVNKVCAAYTTLAPALKAWPPLWDLLPESVKDKHREVKVREKREAVLEVDLSKLTALSTAAKFGL